MRCFIALFLLLLSCSKSSAPSDAPPVKTLPRTVVSKHKLPEPEPIDFTKPFKPADLIDIALQNRAETRQSWHQAKIAAARLGMAKAELYPTLSANANGTHTRTFEFLGGPAITDNRAFAGLALSYLLLDFGGRSASIQEAKEGLKIASWGRDAAMQEVIMEVLGRYYDYLLASELLQAELITEKEAGSRRETAEELWRAGLKTHADVLAAKSDLLQTKLRLSELQKNESIARAALAKTLGLEADAPIDVEPIPNGFDRQGISENLEELIKRAKQKRVELLGLHAQMAQKNLEIKRVKSGFWPKIDVSASSGWEYDQKSPSRGIYNYAVGLSLNAPLFSGFKKTYECKKAYADAQITLFDIEAKEKAISFDVLKNFVSLQAADESSLLSTEYLACAEEAYQAGLEHYEGGVLNIFSLIDLSKTLREARGAARQAHIHWLAALAQLAYATGTLLEDQ